jgi:threonine dehydratase
MRALAPAQREKGVVTVSAGNHAMATAYAARSLGVSTKVEMQRTANPARGVASRALGAEVISAAVKQLRPDCLVFGVEPEGADTMHRSFANGRPERIDAVRAIADSLGAPHAAPYSFGLCRQYVDELLKVDDDALCRSMALLFREMKLAVEPAGAASTAALRGPLAERLRGARVGLIVCGANTGLDAFERCVRRGEALA